MNHTHSWYHDHNGRWFCQDCDAGLSDDAVQMLRILGHDIQVDYARIEADMTPPKEGQP